MSESQDQASKKKSKKKAKRKMPAFKQPPTWVVLVIGGLIGWILHPNQEESPADAGEHDHPGAEASAGDPGAAAEPAIWTCSMHPQIQLPDPGLCPICNMDLIELDTGSANTGPTELKMSETAMALAEITTFPVQRIEVANEVTMVGKIAYDETRQAAIPAWFSGRIDRIFVDSTDIPVKAGDHLVALYSPDLYAAERDFLEARSGDSRLAKAARGRLRLLGMSEEQIQQLEERGSPNENEVVHASIDGVVVHKNALLGRYVKEGEVLYEIADLDQVWLELEAYETDLPWIRFGQDVEFDVTGWPGETFHGRIALISPVLDERSRSIRVRVHVDNRDRRLRPGMFVQAHVLSQLTSAGNAVDPAIADLWICPMHPEVQQEEAGACPKCGMDLVPATELGFVASGAAEAPLVIPATAPLLTGKRAVVYVRMPGKEPHFQGRTVVLGPRAGDWFVVREGLMEGELVVEKGAFRIDAELQLSGKSSMMSPDGGGGGAHDHGGMGGGQEMPAMKPHEMEFPRLQATDAFQKNMGGIARAYVTVQVALAADDLTAAKQAAGNAQAALTTMPHDGVSADDHATWMGLQQQMDKALVGIIEAAGFPGARKHFVALSHALIESVQHFGTQGADGLRLAFCPMADNDQGADWLQFGDDIRNPYFGDEMLQCGEVIVTLGEDQ